MCFTRTLDTEAIVHAWEQWGPGCLDRFRGMPAFAPGDARTRTFFMARDRLGVKPLYYGVDHNGAPAFGSEPKAIVDHPGLDTRTDPQAVEEYLALGYVPDPERFTAECASFRPPTTCCTGRRMPASQHCGDGGCLRRADRDRRGRSDRSPSRPDR
ncbi:MAG: hypothetical protein R3E48_20210 [Burkholderiaceae bacterium]